MSMDRCPGRRGSTSSDARPSRLHSGYRITTGGQGLSSVASKEKVETCSGFHR